MTPDEIEQDAAEHSFRGLPLEHEREKMSVIKLAELMVEKPKDSVAYIVLSHELNLKKKR